jgi:transcription elongation factor Elf1
VRNTYTPPPLLATDLSDPIDVYTDWIDACDEANTNGDGASAGLGASEGTAVADFIAGNESFIAEDSDDDDDDGLVDYQP